MQMESRMFTSLLVAVMMMEMMTMTKMMLMMMTMIMKMKMLLLTMVMMLMLITRKSCNQSGMRDARISAFGDRRLRKGRFSE